MKTKVRFVDPKIEKEFERLSTSGTDDKKLRKWVERAIRDLSNDAHCGIQIPKKLFPKEYIRKYNIDNLWKYNLPNAWRLIYTLQDHEVHLYSIVLEWMSHKDYEKRFKY